MTTSVRLLLLRLLLLALAALLASCKKDEVPPAAPPAPVKPIAATPPKQPPAPTMPAEVELSGTLSAKTKAPRYLVYVSKDPCSAEAKEVTHYGSTNLTAEGGFFLEIFVPQGTVANLCAVALDAGGQITAIASYEKNPLTLKGEGEIMVKDATLSLEDLKAPVAPPKGLPR